MPNYDSLIVVWIEASFRLKNWVDYASGPCMGKARPDHMVE